MKTTVDDLEQLGRRLASEQQSLERSLSNLRQIVDDKQNIGPDYPFDARLEETKKNANLMRSQAISLNQNLSTLSREIADLTRTMEAVDKSQRALEAALGSKLEKEQLVELADQEIKQLGMEHEKINGDRSVEALVSTMMRMEKILEYLKGSEELEQLEKQLPHIVELLNSILASKESLVKFQGLLNKFREAALDYEKRMGTIELSSLSSTVDYYFSRIVHHPIFTKIKIVLEKGETPIYSFQALGDEGSTYIQTRLSNAQKNAAAISLFLANNEKLGDKFAVLLMDDPTQSMDSEHKTLLADVISELSKSRQILLSTEDESFRDLLVEKCVSVNQISLGSWSSHGPVIKSEMTK